MINTAATSSTHSTYRIPRQQNTNINETFNTNDQSQRERVMRTQPHLRWQVLVIFTFFVVTIRFYVLGNRSEVLIYCISGLILVMALLIFSALNLQKKLTTGNINYNTTSSRYEGVHHTRLVNTNHRMAAEVPTSISNQQQVLDTSRCPYVQELTLQDIGSLRRHISNRDTQILAEAVVLLPPSPTHILQNNLEANICHSDSSVSPPPYDMAITLPTMKNKKFIEIDIEGSEDETPPPSYAVVTKLDN